MKKDTGLLASFLVVGVLSVILGLVIAGTEKRDPTAAKPGKVVGALETYTNDQFGISIGHPKGWSVEVEGNGIYFLSTKESAADDIRENINLRIEELPPNESMKTYTDSAIAEVTALPNYELLESYDQKVQKLPAHTITYKATIQGSLLHFQQTWILQGKKSYVFTLAAPEKTFDAHRRVLARMFRSFRINSK